MSSDKYQDMDILFLTIHKLLKIKRKITWDGDALYLSNIEKKPSKQASQFLTMIL